MTIKEARKAAGITQKHLAEILGIPKRTIEDWDAGKHSPPEYVEQLIIDRINMERETR